jgi:hypothetical protein
MSRASRELNPLIRHQHRAVGHRLTLSVFTHQKHVTVAESEDVARVDRVLADIRLRREIRDHP